MSRPAGLPIADYALLSDCHGAALVARDGAIDWLCLPRFDSPATFARLLDPAAGHWAIGPSAPAEATRRYVDGTMVLETSFRRGGAEVALRDALAVGPNEKGHELGARSPHVLLRELRGVRGSMEVDVELAPRPEYGLAEPRLRPVPGGVQAEGGGILLLVRSPVRLSIDGPTARARVTVREGDRIGFALHHAASPEEPPSPWSEQACAARLRETVEAWRSWSAMHQRYHGPYREVVHHSGRVLQALTYHPTGAIVAAPTTSLPEAPGGERNWDYRFSWVRDASFTLDALWVAACPDEASRFFDFLALASAAPLGRGRPMQIVLGIGGEHDLTEHVLEHLAGWRGSAPVRVGNSAWRQRQVDVYGELLSAAARLREHLDEIDPQTRGFLADVADAALRDWPLPDHGIWEHRTEPRHFLYSKLMCWVALDRALGMAELLGAEDRVDRWRRGRETIRGAVEAQGWSERVGAYTQSFGSDALDASALVLPIVGFAEPGDERVKRTVDAVEERLTDARGLVRRYADADGLEGEEGSFLLCTFWLAEARARLGQLDRAREVIDRALACANDVGLLAEEVDPRTGELLGNFPQALSHIGLVNAVWALEEARSSR